MEWTLAPTHGNIDKDKIIILDKTWLNQQLIQAVQEGRFSADIWYRQPMRPGEAATYCYKPEPTRPAAGDTTA